MGDYAEDLLRAHMRFGSPVGKRRAAPYPRRKLTHKCEICAKMCRGEDALKMHTKDKHGVTTGERG